MKTTFLILTVSLMLLAAACSKPEPGSATTAKPPATPSPAIPAATVTIPKDGNYKAKGVVTKINLEAGSVELKHEAIPGVMPAMQMEIPVRGKEQLKPLKVGDNVDFVLEYKHPTETITEIKKAP
jgi:Cu/Ag efflux protein CusF